MTTTTDAPALGAVTPPADIDETRAALLAAKDAVKAANHLLNHRRIEIEARHAAVATGTRRSPLLGKLERKLFDARAAVAAAEVADGNARIAHHGRIVEDLERQLPALERAAAEADQALQAVKRPYLAARSQIEAARSQVASGLGGVRAAEQMRAAREAQAARDPEDDEI